MSRVLTYLSPGAFVLLLLLAVSAYLLILVGGNTLRSYRLYSEEEAMRRQVRELQAQEEQLLQIRDYLRSDEFIEYMARKVFGLVKPGERLAIVEAPQAAPSADEAPGARWWQRLFGR